MASAGELERPVVIDLQPEWEAALREWLEQVSAPGATAAAVGANGVLWAGVEWHRRHGQRLVESLRLQAVVGADR
jgi:hypothetical protein